VTRDLDVRASATPEEAAAIAAAISAHLDAERDEGPSDEGHGEGDPWRGERWRFRGRMATLGVRSARVPNGAPTDRWRAAGRTDRF
jgi:hypothetical protein